MTRRRVRRFARELDYVNTINVRDRVTIDFVWFPGAAVVGTSRIDPRVPNHPRSGHSRHISYRWERDRRRPVLVRMTTGRITISLPSRRSGTLKAFGTEWRISRVGRRVNMDAVTTVRGVQQRLNRLGYHLRRPGNRNAGIDSAYGRRTERAVVQFQCDYVPPVGAASPANNRLQLRGEWQHNAGISSNLTRYHAGSANPSANDGSAFRAALLAAVGA